MVQNQKPTEPINTKPTPIASRVYVYPLITAYELVSQRD